MKAYTLILPLLLACNSGKDTEHIPPSCTYDWTEAPCSAEYLERVRCDPCSRAWLCQTVDWEERYPIWVRQDEDCTCDAAPDGLWHDEGGCGGETTPASDSATAP
jgi:hypothetical protein